MWGIKIYSVNRILQMPDKGCPSQRQTTIVSSNSQFTIWCGCRGLCAALDLLGILSAFFSAFFHGLVICGMGLKLVTILFYTFYIWSLCYNLFILHETSCWWTDAVRGNWLGTEKVEPIIFRQAVCECLKHATWREHDCKERRRKHRTVVHAPAIGDNDSDME